ncbi:Transglycosylase SLT domain-containing protein [Sulfobacillus thermosulfidooxidans DSM 9293]|uniref:Transglycosylase SLT domain-containing protein n=1 Tax=Sulfobacillus thermosulfidooxidans (strain DSM 9293 / VKM B-1269 / AT-1) TaxID=929705 RepID=A0A1W1W6M2_SULTA|nr:lytic transglycosylase domain-containing protein [Sulfobacillus thermosulfidooxidans]SMC01915.1 Transglycosylase SLT domain-containing protein [Sulfobacillus thermosulfidooxidans DSM 9293]
MLRKITVRQTTAGFGVGMRWRSHPSRWGRVILVVALMLLPWLFVQAMPSAQWWQGFQEQEALQTSATAPFTLPANAEERVFRWWPDILIAAQQTKVPPILIAAIMLHESGGVPNAGSPAGAYGLMQIIPSTAQSLPGWYPGARANPGENLILGAELLAENKQATGNWLLATAAYYGGTGFVTPRVSYDAPWSVAAPALAVVPCPGGLGFAACDAANAGLTMTGYVDQVVATMRHVATWQMELALPSSLPNFFPTVASTPGVASDSLVGELDALLEEAGAALAA